MAESEKVFELPYDPLEVHIEPDEAHLGRPEVVLVADGRRFELCREEAEALGMALIRAADRLAGNG